MSYPSILPMAISATASFVEAYINTKKQRQLSASELYNKVLIQQITVERGKTIVNARCKYCDRPHSNLINCEGCGAPK